VSEIRTRLAFSGTDNMKKRNKKHDPLSSLAKIRVKGYAEPQVKSFSSSKVQHHDGKIDNNKDLWYEYEA
jgi:hypothetical protein